jgi:hypothetical protein
MCSDFNMVIVYSLYTDLPKYTVNIQILYAGEKHKALIIKYNINIPNIIIPITLNRI